MVNQFHLVKVNINPLPILIMAANNIISYWKA